MILSICICSLQSRAALLHKLVDHLLKQITNHDEVEILISADNGEKNTGAKRNELYRDAKGEYVCSVDDDDWVSDTYVFEVLKALSSKPDAVAMNGTQTVNGVNHATWDISKYNPYITTRKNGRIHYLRFHNHLSPVKKEIALQFPFPEIKFAEDYAFALAMHNAKAIETEVRIAKPMYEYRFKNNKAHGQ